MSLHEAKTILEKTMKDQIRPQDDTVMFNLFGVLARFADALIRIEAQLGELSRKRSSGVMRWLIEGSLFRAGTAGGTSMR